ncbi:hypothetical protein [Novosphingobium sp. AAP1]|uniref:hypothetical protein n=1 Tax=Novosphingobium sp. AAP1 TaxID=1523413 RepID=UPI0014945CF1|nr:hypothetical protein [Novosphingobium sp. AAP1]
MLSTRIILLCPAAFMVSCGGTGSTQRPDDNPQASFRYQCIIANELGEGSFTKIDGKIFDVVTSRPDADRLAKAVSNTPSRKYFYARVCVQGFFEYKIGMIGHVQTEPRAFIKLTKFEIISSDNDLDELRALMRGAPLPAKSDVF